MIFIKKGQEPGELLKYRKQRHATYRDMPGDVKAVVRARLAEEQGGLCAYCMARLPKVDVQDIGGDGVTIEHCAPQNPKDGGQPHDPLDYRNMLAVCQGNRGKGDGRTLTCDASKGNASIVVSPLKRETLADIYYKGGEIHSHNAEIDADLNDTLNLNSEAASLPQRRRAALGEVFSVIQKECGSGPITKAYIQKLLNHYESETGEKTPYVGILTWWLRKKLGR